MPDSVVTYWVGQDEKKPQHNRENVHYQFLTTIITLA